MDHQYHLESHIWNEEELPNINKEEILYNKIDSENTSDTNISIQEKIGDDYLIELYRQKKFLYDKTDRNFKDNDVKNNSWKEISTIMAKDKNLGKHYTPEYCKKRITSLREQYVKLKKEYDLKSGSAAFTKKQSSLLSQLCFLNKYIQRRRTLTNIKQKENEQMSTTSLNKYAVVGQETNVAENKNFNKSESEKSSSQSNTDEYELSEDPTSYQKPQKVKKKFSERRNDDESLRDLTNAAMNICSQLQMSSTSHEDVGSKCADRAFSDFIVFTLQGMEEPERSIRRNKLFQALTASLD